MPDNPRGADAERRLNAIRRYQFKASDNMLDEEAVFLLGQIDDRDAALSEAREEIERLKQALSSHDGSRQYAIVERMSRTEALENIVKAARIACRAGAGLDMYRKLSGLACALMTFDAIERKGKLEGERREGGDAS